MTGRPGWPCRTFQIQNRRKPLRCQATTVSGLTMASAERESLQMRESQTHNRRSTEVNSGDFSQIPEAHQFAGAEPGSPAEGQHAHGRSKTELRKV
jgi:hypothetical protein